jgi:5'-3' exonuclease
MIIMDYSQVIISNLMVEIGGRTDVELDVNLLRHMIINAIRANKAKFGKEYGELVIACDSRKYWRKQEFPYYKANRKKAREESGFNWPLIFDTINLLKEEIKAVFPYRVIEVEGAEADDIIASLVFWSVENDMTENALFEEPKPLLIISGDHDFNQLQKYKHVKQYSPVQKKFVKPKRPLKNMCWSILLEGIKETVYLTFFHRMTVSLVVRDKRKLCRQS